MNRPEPNSFAPIQHPPGPGFIPVDPPDPTVQRRPRFYMSLFEWTVVAGICMILVALLLPTVQAPRGGGATHSSRSEREARRLELQRALAEQEELLRTMPAEETDPVTAPDRSE